MGKSKNSKPATPTPYPVEDRCGGVYDCLDADGLGYARCALGCSLATWLFVRTIDTPPPSLAVLPGLLLIIAGISGIVALVLTPVVTRLRKAKPPRIITGAVILICSTPWLLLIAFELMRQ